MRRIAMTGLAVLLLGACARQPDDVQGVGFGPYSNERADREAALSGTGQPQTVLPPSGQQGGTDIASLAEGAIAEAESGSTATTEAPVTTAHVGISDEQDFEAVSERESIESDAERLRRMQEQRVVVAPTAVPDRPGSTGPNIIQYALSTTNGVGEARYRRMNIAAGARHERNCLSYRSDDLAQEAFLRMGGPERDRQALDPDGDGFACNWDPTVYRNAAAAARNGQ